MKLNVNWNLSMDDDDEHDDELYEIEWFYFFFVTNRNAKREIASLFFPAYHEITTRIETKAQAHKNVIIIFQFNQLRSKNIDEGFAVETKRDLLLALLLHVILSIVFQLNDNVDNDRTTRKGESERERDWN